jgi:hypothetical protein
MKETVATGRRTWRPGPESRTVFASVKALITAIRAFIDGWNERCQPFEWTKQPTRSWPRRSVKQLQKRDTSQSVCDGRPSVDT